MQRRSFARAVSILIAAVMTLTPVATAADGDAGTRVLRGKVVRAGGEGIEGASVVARDVTSGTEYASPLTTASGVYETASLPPGTYEITIRTPEGAYAGEKVMNLERGSTHLWSFRIAPATTPEGTITKSQQQEPEAGTPEGTGTGKPRKGRAHWNKTATNGVVGTAFIIAGLYVWNVNDGNNDVDASPSGP